jgi:hypothetical protein
MLNVFLHEKHTVAEERLYAKRSSDLSHHGGAGQTATAQSDAQAVKALDKYIRGTTDARLLREARKMQNCASKPFPGFSRCDH